LDWSIDSYFDCFRNTATYFMTTFRDKYRNSPLIISLNTPYLCKNPQDYEIRRIVHRLILNACELEAECEESESAFAPGSIVHIPGDCRPWWNK